MSVITDLIDENSSCHARISELEARIVELESAAESLRLSRDYHHEQEIEYRRRWAGIYATPVSEANAQGVVMQATDGGRNPRYEGLFDGETEEHRAFRLNATHVQQVSVPDGFVLAKETVVEMPDGSKELGYTTIGRVGIFNSAEEVFDAIRELDLPLGWVSMTTEQLLPGWMLNAAPAAPAADAGLIDMYRHLQTVTPYRFKKIQDASVTDGGDVLYFHKDRFDAALLDDMAAHCAAKGVV